MSQYRRFPNDSGSWGRHDGSGNSREASQFGLGATRGAQGYVAQRPRASESQSRGFGTPQGFGNNSSPTRWPATNYRSQTRKPNTTGFGGTPAAAVGFAQQQQTFGSAPSGWGGKSSSATGQNVVFSGGVVHNPSNKSSSSHSQARSDGFGNLSGRHNAGFQPQNASKGFGTAVKGFGNAAGGDAFSSAFSSSGIVNESINFARSTSTSSISKAGGSGLKKRSSLGRNSVSAKGVISASNKDHESGSKSMATQAIAFGQGAVEGGKRGRNKRESRSMPEGMVHSSSTKQSTESFERRGFGLPKQSQSADILKNPAHGSFGEKMKKPNLVQQSLQFGMFGRSEDSEDLSAAASSSGSDMMMDYSGAHTSETQRIAPRQLFVRIRGARKDEQSLEQCFSEFGDIETIVSRPDKSIGFVTMREPNDAEKAVQVKRKILDDGTEYLIEWSKTSYRESFMQDSNSSFSPKDTNYLEVDVKSQSHVGFGFPRKKSEESRTLSGSVKAKREEKQREIAELKRRLQAQMRRKREEFATVQKNVPFEEKKTTISDVSTPKFGTAVFRKRLSVPEPSLLIADHVSQTLPEDVDDDEDSGPCVGLCTEMCPQSEIHEREMHDEIHLFEQPFGDERDLVVESRPRPIKRMVRSSAGKRMNNPLEVRTHDTLVETLQYIWNEILDISLKGRDPRLAAARNYTSGDGATPTPAFVFSFLQDRTRSIRKDFSLQAYGLPSFGPWSVLSVRAFEQMARMHAMADHILCEATIDESHDERLNRQELSKTLKSLLTMYERAHRENFSEKQEYCRNWGEFAAYYVLLMTKYESVVQLLQLLPNSVLTCKYLRLALEIWRNVQGNGNPVRFLMLIKSPYTPYLIACLMHGHLQRVWQNYISILRSTLPKNSRSATPWLTFTYETLGEIMFFNDQTHARDYFDYLGFSTPDGVHVNLDPQNSYEVPETTFPRRVSLVIESRRYVNCDEKLSYKPVVLGLDHGRISPVGLEIKKVNEIAADISSDKVSMSVTFPISESPTELSQISGIDTEKPDEMASKQKPSMELSRISDEETALILQKPEKSVSSKFATAPQVSSSSLFSNVSPIFQSRLFEQKKNEVNTVSLEKKQSIHQPKSWKPILSFPKTDLLKQGKIFQYADSDSGAVFRSKVDDQTVKSIFKHPQLPKDPPRIVNVDKIPLKLRKSKIEVSEKRDEGLLRAENEKLERRKARKMALKIWWWMWKRKILFALKAKKQRAHFRESMFGKLQDGVFSTTMQQQYFDAQNMVPQNIRVEKVQATSMSHPGDDFIGFEKWLPPNTELLQSNLSRKFLPLRSRLGVFLGRELIHECPSDIWHRKKAVRMFWKVTLIDGHTCSRSISCSMCMLFRWFTTKLSSTGCDTIAESFPKTLAFFTTHDSRLSVCAKATNIADKKTAVDSDALICLLDESFIGQAANNSKLALLENRILESSKNVQVILVLPPWKEITARDSIVEELVKRLSANAGLNSEFCSITTMKLDDPFVQGYSEVDNLSDAKIDSILIWMMTNVDCPYYEEANLLVQSDSFKSKWWSRLADNEIRLSDMEITACFRNVALSPPFVKILFLRDVFESLDDSVQNIWSSYNEFLHLEDEPSRGKPVSGKYAPLDSSQIYPHLGEAFVLDALKCICQRGIKVEIPLDLILPAVGDVRFYSEVIGDIVNLIPWSKTCAGDHSQRFAGNISDFMLSCTGLDAWVLSCVDVKDYCDRFNSCMSELVPANLKSDLVVESWPAPDFFQMLCIHRDTTSTRQFISPLEALLEPLQNVRIQFSEIDVAELSLLKSRSRHENLERQTYLRRTIVGQLAVFLKNNLEPDGGDTYREMGLHQWILVATDLIGIEIMSALDGLSASECLSIWKIAVKQVILAKLDSLGDAHFANVERYDDMLASIGVSCRNICESSAVSRELQITAIVDEIHKLGEHARPPVARVEEAARLAVLDSTAEVEHMRDVDVLRDFVDEERSMSNVFEEKLSSLTLALDPHQIWRLRYNFSSIQAQKRSLSSYPSLDSVSYGQRLDCKQNSKRPRSSRFMT